MPRYDPGRPLEMLLWRLDSHVRLEPADREAILRLPHSIRTLETAAYLIREGEVPFVCAMLLEGFVFRQKLTQDGARELVSLHIPGDPLDLQMLLLGVADHNVQALTRATLAIIPRQAMQALVAERPGIAHAVMVVNLVDASIGREWLLNIGRRNARERLAHLLCEFACRMETQGLAPAGVFELPMTQEQLGDALGLTSVHVNRTLKVLEAEGAIRREGRRIGFDDIDRIRSIAGFSSLYLHLDQRSTSDLPR